MTGATTIRRGKRRVTSGLKAAVAIVVETGAIMMSATRTTKTDGATVVVVATSRKLLMSGVDEIRSARTRRSGSKKM